MANGAKSRNGKNGRSNGRKRTGNGNNGRPLSWTKRLALYRAFCVEQTTNYVVKVCGVADATARKYRELDDWDGRIQRLRERALKETDNKVAKMLERQAADALKVQGLAMVKLLDKGFTQEDVALRGFEVGARIERLAQGEAGERTEVSLMDAIVKAHGQQVAQEKGKKKNGNRKGKK